MESIELNEDDEFIFKAIDDVLNTLSSKFKYYSPDFILEILRQNSMDIGKTYNCLKHKKRNTGFTSLDDKVLLKRQGEEYNLLFEEKGMDTIKKREYFLNQKIINFKLNRFN
jgi:hypothetical protein